MEFFAAEYKYTREDFESLTAREVSEMLDAMLARKTGKKKVQTSLNDEQEKKIAGLGPANFKDRKRGK